MRPEASDSFEELCAIVAELRSDHGCPWDRAQTHESLHGCMVEEAYEAAEAMRIFGRTGCADALVEELGDVLLQVLLHSEIGRQEGAFTLQDVIRGLAAKMIHRHPHVFPDEEGRIVPEDQVDWDALKREEKPEQTPLEEIAGVPESFPALIRSAKVMKKLEKYRGSDSCEEEPSAAVRRRLERLLAASGAQEEKREAGELLLAVSELCRKRGINAEEALKDTLEGRIRAAAADWS